MRNAFQFGRVDLEAVTVDGPRDSRSHVRGGIFSRSPLFIFLHGAVHSRTESGMLIAFEDLRLELREREQLTRRPPGSAVDLLDPYRFDRGLRVLDQDPG